VAKELERRHLLRNVRERGEQLRQGLESLVERFPNMLQQARGWGLLQGLVLREDCDLNAAAVVKAALDQKLLIVPAGPKVVRMVPALVISRRDVAALLTRLERTLQLLQA
jgi:acetylornithine aminotransferase